MEITERTIVGTGEVKFVLEKEEKAVKSLK